jgi:hypothetical protein
VWATLAQSTPKRRTDQFRSGRPHEMRLALRAVITAGNLAQSRKEQSRCLGGSVFRERLGGLTPRVR